MAMINYADKEALNLNAGVPAINKIEAGNMNEIKTALNNYVQTGWYTGNTGTTYSYVSWNATTKIGIVGTNQDTTSLLSVGMKVKFTQNATVKYGIIVAITSTQITLFMGTDYTLLNAVITNAFYSMLRSPYGFPMDPKKWTLELNSVAGVTQTSPTINTWYNLGGLSILLPVGIWDTYYQAETQHQRATAGYPSVYCALSTNASSVSDNDLKTQGFFFSATICTLILSTRKTITVTTPTTFYLIASTDQTGTTDLMFRGTLTPTIVRATCAYL